MTTASSSAFNHDRWLPYGDGSLAGTALLCFPYAGAAAAVYRDWCDELPTSLQVLPVELPGHGGRFGEPLLSSVQDLALAAADSLETLCRQPYTLFGHSLGALLAFELSRVFVNRGQAPLHLFVSGSRAPSLFPIEPGAHLLGAQALHERLRSWGGVPEEILAHPQLLARLEPALRADLEASDQFVCSSFTDLQVPITAFAGMSDPLAPPHSVAEWSRFTSNYFALRMLPGNHFFLHNSRQALLGMIVREIDFASARLR